MRWNIEDAAPDAGASELVCPEFYDDTWEKEGRKRREDHDEFPNAADDGICCLESYDEATGIFTCRCGQMFGRDGAKRLALR